ncbi:MAG TPA: hypothetical protein VHP14_19805 [Anaerolineales bacterium]|nr:hypothetical protein [Anaerolineales bacterium]
MSRTLSRKDFLRLSTLSLGALTGGRLLSACNPAPTATLAAAQPTVTPTPEVLQFTPTAPPPIKSRAKSFILITLAFGLTNN